MKKTGFTALEMLVVIAVIGILATFLLPALERAKDRAKMGRAKAMVESLNAAVRMYYHDFGAYPVTTGARGNVYSTRRLINALSTKYEAIGSDYISAGPYMEFHQKDMGYEPGAWPESEFPPGLLDPWGNYYVYDRPITTEVTEIRPINVHFDIYSKGPDGLYGDGITKRAGDSSMEDANNDGIDDDDDNLTNWD